MAFLEPDGSMPTPASTVRLDGHDKCWPADWEIRGFAYGLADWSVVIHGGPLDNCGREVSVRLSTPLGVLEGKAVVTNSVITEDLEVTSNLIGAGLLRFVEARA